MPPEILTEFTVGVLQESRYIQWNQVVREIKCEFGSRIAVGICKSAKCPFNDNPGYASTDE
jgi:hypothetical protein